MQNASLGNGETSWFLFLNETRDRNELERQVFTDLKRIMTWISIQGNLSSFFITLNLKINDTSDGNVIYINKMKVLRV